MPKKATKKSSKKRSSRANQPETLTLFKVVKRGNDDKPKSKALTSIFTRGLLRLTYNKNTFTKAPAPQLPITGFDTRANAERFIARNRRRMEYLWVLVKGVGVPADDNKVQPERLSRPCDLKAKSVKGLATAIRKKVVSRRNTTKWTRGTVFVQNFKITEVLAEYAPE